MRIAIFQDTYHPKVDGIVVSTDLIAKELRRRGHEVLLIVPRHPSAILEPEEDVILVEALAADNVYPDSCVAKISKAHLGEVFAKRPPDIIHTMTELTLGVFVAEYWRWKLRVPRVHTFHTLLHAYMFYGPIFPEAFWQWLLRFVAPRWSRWCVDRLIAPTEAMRDALRDEWKVRDVPIDVVPTGIDLAQFQKCNGAAFRAKHRIRKTDKVVLYMGRIGPEKNPELVLTTFAELRRRGARNLRLVMAGGGAPSYMEKLHRLAESLGLSDVLWTGFITGQEWLDCYGASDLMLFPSQTETQGLVLLEALAAGVPIVSLNAMGAGSVLSGERGCLFAESNTQSFADAAGRLLHDEVLRALKRREGLELVKTYSVEQRTRELEAVYTSLLAPRLAKAPDVLPNTSGERWAQKEEVLEVPELPPRRVASRGSWKR